MSADTLDDDFDPEHDDSPTGVDDRYMFEAKPMPAKPTTLTEAEVTRRQVAEIADIGTLLNTTPERAAVLLQRFDWRTETLRDRWFEDPDAVQRAIGISLAPSEIVEKPITTGFSCGICWDVESDTVISALSPCQHYFHKSCFKQYLTEEMQSKSSSSLLASCPMAGCANICDLRAFSHFFHNDEAMMTKYFYYRLSSYVEAHPRYRWCPTCRLPVYNEDFIKSKIAEKSHVVQCTACNEEFCFSCGREAHAPATCKQLRLWLQKEQDESETANWVAANTKPCPNCSSTIEKNGGCNHMSCSQCKLEFCWICENPWEKHGNSWYKCNFYNEKVDNTKSHRDKAKRELERYIFYYTRYRTHDQSKKLESALMQRVKQRMLAMQTSDARLHDVEYLEGAAHQLTQCRHALKYTYVYAFYLLGVQGKELFEHNQDQLERQTEKLSEMLETSQKHDRQSIVTCAQVAKHMLLNLREGKYSEDE
jgi:ariadne-1